MPSDFAIHSDLLVHWTGKDIDQEHQPNWVNEDQEEICEKAIEEYLNRLRNILKFGLWMTNQEGWTTPCRSKIQVPQTPAVCFTELKLSQSRSHAIEYGRLGIAVKRPFVFMRDGRPMAYFEPRFGSDPLLDEFALNTPDKRLLQFFKPMDSGSGRRLQYDYYSESEWRIVAGAGDRCAEKIVDPRESEDPNVRDYWSSLQAPEKDKLQYLVPLDGWHAAVVYPGLKVKNAAQEESSGVRELLKSVAQIGHARCVEGENLPVELDLDLCRNL